MTDYDAIRNLCASYTHHLDEGDFDGVADILGAGQFQMIGKNGGWDPKVVVGRDKIHEFYAGQVVTYDGDPKTRHVLTNQHIEISEDGKTGKSRSYFTLLQGPPDQRFAVLCGGQYHDSFEKTDEGWRFTEKICQVDFENDNSTEHFEIATEYSAANS